MEGEGRRVRKGEKTGIQELRGRNVLLECRDAILGEGGGGDLGRIKGGKKKLNKS